MEIPVNHPGFEGRGLVVAPGGLFGGAALKIDGTPIKLEKRACVLQDNQGRKVEMRLKPRFYDPIPDLEIDGKTTSLAEPFRWHEYLWMGWPLVLLFQGGAIGAAIGYCAYRCNTNIFRGDRGPLAKYVLTFVVSAGAFVSFFALAIAIRILINSAR